ncbi:MAG: 23S rRNA (pseudouridine(1915)-N(3))-methyltransferase RlmH [Pseudomonadota bacterium]
MKIRICAVGRLRSGPERELFDDYAKRFDRLGRSHGLGPIELVEVEAKKGLSEADALLRALPDPGQVCALDERGRTLTSPDFADLIARWRDQGHTTAAFVIGGADGLGDTLRARADTTVSFGSMVWPHMLARVMLSEQLYRAASILAGAPYHRE